MNQDMNQEPDVVKPFESMSKVTPHPKRQSAIRHGQLVLLVLICVVILAYMFMPHAAKSHASLEEQVSDVNDATLSQNLELIERMKLEERNRLIASGVKSAYPKEYGPPKLKKHKAEHGQALSKEMLLRMNAPTSFDIELPPIHTASSQEGHVSASPGSKTMVGADQNSAFINNQSDITAVSAQKLPHPALTIPAGEIIPATLETSINSDLPGIVRAITTRDIYSLLDGNLLLPKGSSIVGQFNSAVVEGQNRILVVWNRVQMSDGVIVTLNSPGTDTLGRSGLEADGIDRHFFERFGSSALLSVLGAYTATAGVSSQDQYNSAAQYRMALANSFQQTSGQTLEKSINIAPTLQINQGTRINIFVAHDLDFASVGVPQIAPTKIQRRPVWK